MINHYLVRATKPTGAVSRYFTTCEDAELLDFIMHDIGDKVEFKNMGPNKPTFKVPGYYMPFFTQTQADSYMSGYSSGINNPLLTCALEDFSQVGRFAAVEQAQERMRDREESRRSRRSEE